MLKPLKFHLLVYLLPAKETPVDSKYLLSKILKTRYKYLAIFPEGKESIQTFTEAF